MRVGISLLLLLLLLLLFLAAANDNDNNANDNDSEVPARRAVSCCQVEHERIQTYIHTPTWRTAMRR